MKVLVGCEFSGIVTEAFRKRGHDAWSCDLLPSEGTPYHIQADIQDLQGSKEWDMVGTIRHPLAKTNTDRLPTGGRSGPSRTKA